ncbi:DUF6386 family protein [Paenibacillus sp. 7516]|uniref:DUF6386 family protein n=1 Tax=Paenibacillus sp. 7516 TaxID=2022549 RepID=UPI001481D9FA|nr:DUF6386 family protein [Paenibacillus sp. 7516]
MRGTFQFVTGTATMCLFDLASLKHRVEEPPDWWSIPEDELAEVNAGNCLFFNLGADGMYEVSWSVDISHSTSAVPEGAQVFYLQVPTGSVFLGAAEDVSGGELEPDESCDGMILSLQPGNVACIVSREGNQISLKIQPGTQGHNEQDSLIRI